MSSDAMGYGEFKRGWPVVLSAMLGIGLGLSPVPFYTIGMLAPQLSHEFGWSFKQILSGIVFSTLAVIIVSPMVGILADRFGVRKVTLTSVFLFGLSFMGFALSNGSIILFYVNWGLMAALGAGTLPITWTRAVNNRFEIRKGLALGICLLGTGLFGYFVKPFTAWVINGYGWRAAYIAIGALPLLIALPVAIVCFRDVGPAKVTAAARKASQAARRDATPGLTAKEAFTNWRFWVLAMAILPISFAVGGPIPNMETILKLHGFSPRDVVHLASLIGASVIVGRIIGGWLIDRVWAPGIALFLLSIPAAACLVLAHGPFSYAVTALSVVLVGFAAGLEYDLMAFLVARYFGMKSYSVIYGTLYCFFAIGSGFAPVIFGASFDKTHSYAFSLTLSAYMMVSGALLLLALGRYRTFERSPIVEEVTALGAVTPDTMTPSAAITIR